MGSLSGLLSSASVFPVQVSGSSYVQDIFYALATVCLLFVVAAIGLIDAGLVRRKNLLDTWVQKLVCAALAHNLIRWTATIGQPAPLDRLTVARTVRFQLLAIPARLVNRSGTLTLRCPARWPWAQLFTGRLSTIRALPSLT